MITIEHLLKIAATFLLALLDVQGSIIELVLGQFDFGVRLNKLPGFGSGRSVGHLIQLVVLIPLVDRIVRLAILESGEQFEILGFYFILFF